MEKTDLGDRYTNSLKYLIAPNLETISDFESPVVTDRSESDPTSINSELISMLETLSQTINLEHRHRNNSEVFIPPSDFNDLEVSSKITFIHSLTQSLSTYISTGKFPITQFSEGEQLETPKLRVKKDVISRLVNCNDGVYLNHNDLKQLAAMLIGSFRDSAKFQVKELAGVNKAKLELKKKEFKEVSEEMDLLNSNQEKMIFENTNLRNE